MFPVIIIVVVDWRNNKNKRKWRHKRRLKHRETRCVRARRQTAWRRRSWPSPRAQCCRRANAVNCVARCEPCTSWHKKSSWRCSANARRLLRSTAPNERPRATTSPSAAHLQVCVSTHACVCLISHSPSPSLSTVPESPALVTKMRGEIHAARFAELVEQEEAAFDASSEAWANDVGFSLSFFVSSNDLHYVQFILST